MTYLPLDSAPSKSVIFRISAARCLSVASSRKPEKSLILGDESAIGCLFLWFVSFGQAKEMNNPTKYMAY